MAHVRGKWLRTNYRLSGGKQDINEMGSIMVKLRQSWQLDSGTGDVVTISMDGYGVPAWVLVKPLNTIHGGTAFQVIAYCIDLSTSLVYVSLAAQPMTYTNAGTFSLGSAAATGTVAMDIVALIASR